MSLATLAPPKGITKKRKKKHHLGPQNDPRSFEPEKLKNIAKMENCSLS